MSDIPTSIFVAMAIVHSFVRTYFLELYSIILGVFCVGPSLYANNYIGVIMGVNCWLLIAGILFLLIPNGRNNGASS